MNSKLLTLYFNYKVLMKLINDYIFVSFRGYATAIFNSPRSLCCNCYL